MVEDLVDNLHALRQADSIIARLWLDAAARRVGLLAGAGVIAAVGIGMADVAGFYALLPSQGPVWAAAIVAAVDFVLAAATLVVSRSVKPDREIERAFDARKMAIEAIRADVGELKATGDAWARDIRDAKDSILEFAHDPLNSAIQKVLIPAATALIDGWLAKKAPPSTD